MLQAEPLGLYLRLSARQTFNRVSTLRFAPFSTFGTCCCVTMSVFGQISPAYSALWSGLCHFDADPDKFLFVVEEFLESFFSQFFLQVGSEDLHAIATVLCSSHD